MRSELEGVLEEARRRLLYSEEEYLRLEREAERVAGAVRRSLEKQGIRAEVVIAGSLPKRTMLRGYSDIDIFVRLPTGFPRESFGELVARVGDEVFGRGRYWMRYADHPYIEAEVEGVTYSVVPSYAVGPGEWRTPVDRTYYHLRYVEGKLRERPELRGDVTLLKAFMRRIGVYGAEVYVKGFSGYLCELLVIHYGSLLSLFRAALKWRPPVVVDPEGHYRGSEGDLPRLFRGPMIVVDPVDRSRNAASAVSERSLAIFISAVRAFMRRPHIEFFNVWSPAPPREVPLPPGTCLACVLFKHGREVPDIVYSQAERVARKVVRQLEIRGFEVLRWEVYSDFERSSAVVMALPHREVPRVSSRKGPEPHMTSEEGFLERNRGKFIWIDRDGRWKVLEERRVVRVDDAVREALASISVPQTLTSRGGWEVLVGEEVDVHPEASRWAREFRSRREFWVDL